MAHNRFWVKRFLASLCLIASLGAATWPGGAAADALSDTVWNGIRVFEGNFSTVTGDFDGQGMSIGINQWNVGKSYTKVKQIVMAVPASERTALMPVHGKDFFDALSRGEQPTLTYIKSLQTYADPKAHDANKRKARWTEDGKLFARELGKLLSTSHSVAMQRELRSDIFDQGRRNAIRWAQATRGSNSEPTLKEIAYFVDMQNFHGGGLEQFGLPYAALSPVERQTCPANVLAYLRSADDAFLLHKSAARKNATLLDPSRLTADETDLFCLAYQVAMKISKCDALQFKLTTINRRAAILFGEAYYSDNDPRPTTISFAQHEATVRQGG